MHLRPAGGTARSVHPAQPMGKPLGLRWFDQPPPMSPHGSDFRSHVGGLDFFWVSKPTPNFQFRPIAQDVVRLVLPQTRGHSAPRPGIQTGGEGGGAKTCGDTHGAGLLVLPQTPGHSDHRPGIHARRGWGGAVPGRSPARPHASDTHAAPDLGFFGRVLWTPRTSHPDREQAIYDTVLRRPRHGQGPWGEAEPAGAAGLPT